MPRQRANAIIGATPVPQSSRVETLAPARQELQAEDESHQADVRRHLQCPRPRKEGTLVWSRTSQKLQWTQGFPLNPPKNSMITE